MIWKFVQASSIGISHVANNEINQDNCIAGLFTISDEEYFICLVSDGAGSAMHGGKGSDIACEVGKDIIVEWLKNAGPSPLFMENDVRNWISSIQEKIYKVAELNNLTLRDYACTVLCAIVGTKTALFFQVGDGAMIVRESQDYCTVFWPDNGEYANTTHFITDEDVFEHLHINFSELPVDEIAIFTDGLQRLALKYESQTVHNPFFKPMFKVLRKADKEECCSLSEQLTNFLGSTKINERTDDDKTLVLATRIPYETDND